MDFAASIFPILLLIWLLTKRNAMASHVALPLVAALIYVLQFIWFKADPNQINATVVNGVLAALTPITIIWGAIFLFKTMELSGGMGPRRARGREAANGCRELHGRGRPSP